MGAATSTVQQAYEAFGRKDVPAILNLVADDVDWVLGWERATAIDTGRRFESEWVHVFTVKGGKITRWRGFFNTAPRYGL